VSLRSADFELAAAGAGIHPLTMRVWIVAIVALAAFAGGMVYFLAVIRRRSD
jgi:hypothetical protein